MAQNKKLKTIVNRQFLLNLANDIYDPKTRHFLRLCDGTLQNGPDPTNKKRPMHCGLGELYYAMTGDQPQKRNATETDVIDLAVELSTLPNHEKEVLKAIAGIKSMKLSSNVKKWLLDGIHNLDEYNIEKTIRRMLFVML